MDEINDLLSKHRDHIENIFDMIFILTHFYLQVNSFFFHEGSPISRLNFNSISISFCFSNSGLNSPRLMWKQLGAGKNWLTRKKMQECAFERPISKKTYTCTLKWDWKLMKNHTSIFLGWRHAVSSCTNEYQRRRWSHEGLSLVCHSIRWKYFSNDIWFLLVPMRKFFIYSTNITGNSRSSNKKSTRTKDLKMNYLHRLSVIVQSRFLHCHSMKIYVRRDLIFDKYHLIFFR